MTTRTSVFPEPEMLSTRMAPTQDRSTETVIGSKRLRTLGYSRQPLSQSRTTRSKLPSHGLKSTQSCFSYVYLSYGNHRPRQLDRLGEDRQFDKKEDIVTTRR